MRVQAIAVQVGIVAGGILLYHLCLGRKPSSGKADEGLQAAEAALAPASDLASVQAQLEELERKLANLEQQTERASSDAREPLADDEYVTRAELDNLLAEISGEEPLEFLSDPNRVHAALARYQEKVRDFWREQKPQVSSEIAVEVDQNLSQVLELIEDAASRVGEDPSELAAALEKELAAVRFKNSGQVTILDRDGNFVYHVQGLTGSSLNHKNVAGDYAYQDVLRSKAGKGSLNYFDFLQDDRARDVYLNYQRLPGLDWYVLVEGHEWKAMEE